MHLCSNRPASERYTGPGSMNGGISRRIVVCELHYKDHPPVELEPRNVTTAERSPSDLSFGAMRELHCREKLYINVNIAHRLVYNKLFYRKVQCLVSYLE